jgi:glucose/arabinose dehydrogenase
MAPYHLSDKKVSGTAVVPSSYREVLRIRQYNRAHNTDQIMFNPNLVPGDPGYGLMFVGVGDGINRPSHTDPYDQAQNPRSPLGKLLRIDPLPRGGAPYTVPADNPFINNTRYEPAVYALGFRHPLNMCFDRGGKRAFIVTDVGQAHCEEINLIYAGGNYGWPMREGMFATNRFDAKILYVRPANDKALGYIYPVAHYDHSEGQAITGGFVYRGDRVPGLTGQYVFGDIVTGRVFHVAADEFRLGKRARVFGLTLRSNGSPVTMRTLLNTVGRVDLRFGQDEDGELYLSSKQDGIIRKLVAP